MTEGQRKAAKQFNRAYAKHYGSKRRSVWGIVFWVVVTALFVTAWDVEVYGVTLWRGWPGRIADALHEAHGGESHSGREGK